MINAALSLLRSRASKEGAFLSAYLAMYVDHVRYRSSLAGPMQDLGEGAEESRILKELREHGVYVIPNYWDKAKCADAREEVDRILTEYGEHAHPNGKSDERIYGANNVSPLVAEFGGNAQLERIASAYNCEPTRSAFTLAARMPAKPGNLGSGEGWHRDAPQRQFKAILYLSDVGADNGPFQRIRDSQDFAWIKRDTWAARLRYPQYRIAEEQVSVLLRRNPDRLITYTASQGTLILVDTSAIHRGMPIKAGVRYALTNYYYPNNHIDDAMLERFCVIRSGAGGAC